MTKPPESQRKSPKQGRSKALVDSIFEATVRILPKVGSYNVTTKKIADLAGVSVGSLYQYFPNKEAVLGAVMDFTIQVQREAVHAKIDEIKNHSLEDFANGLVDFALEMFLAERERTRELFRQAPELGRVPAMMRLRQDVVERLASEASRHAPGLTQEEYVRMGFITVNAVMGIIHTMLYDESQNYSREDLSRELKSMMNAYLNDRLKS